MDLITIDFETFYSQDFSLSKMTTEEYVRDPRFEVIGVSVKVNDEATEWASGTHEQLKDYFNGFDWKDSMVLAHNTMFDGAILSWLFDIHPRVWADTLCISRAVHGVEVGGSLKALAERYQIGAKGTEVLDAKGKRRLDFTDEELDKYGDYCINDVELTYKLFGIMGKKFPRQELKIIDLTLRMFIEPMLDLDLGLLEQHLEDTKELKDKLLLDAGVDKKGLMSNPKFAGLLEILGVVPPMKTSLTTGKETFAFAKSDEGFKALLEHEDVRVQTLVNARLGNKSTLEETRTQRFIDIAKRGLLPVPVKYYAAHTGRWGGADKINLQNLPSRGPNGKKLKKSMIAPDGYVLIDCDSSQIEARVLAWLAGQEDLTEAFRVGDDVYKKMAMSIYGANREEDITKDQRFVGKTTILGAGYGMGAVRFKEQLRSFGFEMDLSEARRVISVYREANFKITTLWRDAGYMLETHGARWQLTVWVRGSTYG
jgi:DNA polymerase I-like protein with 3'-5' exonuclease and polymerase domains